LKDIIWRQTKKVNKLAKQGDDFEVVPIGKVCAREERRGENVSSWDTPSGSMTDFAIWLLAPGASQEDQQGQGRKALLRADSWPQEVEEGPWR